MPKLYIGTPITMGVRGLELGDQRVGVIDYRLLLWRARLGFGDERAKARAVEMGHRGHIAHDDVAAQPGNELVGEGGRLAAGTEEAAVDLECFHAALNNSSAR
jgi:hypothetical protein